MAYVISNDCILCFLCEGACPLDAITMVDNRYEIDADFCNDCGICAEICFIDAIKQA